MEKKQYTEANVEVCTFDSKDVLTGSFELGENETPILPIGGLKTLD